MYKILLSTITTALLLTTANAKDDHGHDAHKHGDHTKKAAVHWGYGEDAGPLKWGDLKSEYFMCKEGKNQSPINITSAYEVEKKPLKINHKAGGEEVIFNGHAVQVNYKAGSSIDVDGHVFELKQFHFHNPSENTIDGKSFPMEAHFVHADKDGNLAVLGLMFVEGEANAELAKLIEVLPKKAGEKNKLKTVADSNGLLPKEKDYYRFTGSLTTPPCSEGVIWAVFKKPVSASKEQLEAIASVLGHANNRPTQPINARIIGEID